jgi:hypothetical protein
LRPVAVPLMPNLDRAILTRCYRSRTALTRCANSVPVLFKYPIRSPRTGVCHGPLSRIPRPHDRPPLPSQCQIWAMPARCRGALARPWHVRPHPRATAPTSAHSTRARARKCARAHDARPPGAHTRGEMAFRYSAFLGEPRFLGLRRRNFERNKIQHRFSDNFVIFNLRLIKLVLQLTY